MIFALGEIVQRDISDVAALRGRSSLVGPKGRDTVPGEMSSSLASVVDGPFPSLDFERLVSGLQLTSYGEADLPLEQRAGIEAFCKEWQADPERMARVLEDAAAVWAVKLDGLTYDLDALAETAPEELRSMLAEYIAQDEINGVDPLDDPEIGSIAVALRRGPAQRVDRRQPLPPGPSHSRAARPSPRPRSSRGSTTRVRGSRRTGPSACRSSSDDPDPEPVALRGAHDDLAAVAHG